MRKQDKKDKKISKRVITNTILGVSLSVMSVCTPVLEVLAISKSESTSSAPKPLYSLHVNENILKSATRETEKTEEKTEDTVPVSEAPSSSAESETTSPSNDTGSTGGETSSSSEGTSTSSSLQGTSSSTGSSTPSGGNSSTSSSANKKPASSSAKPSSSGNSSSSSTKPSSSSSSSTSSTKKDTSTISYSRNQSTAEFIEEIGEDAREIGQQNNLYASIMIAQAILESGSGNSSLARTPNYNLFGIKGSYQGNSVEMATLEDDGDGGLYTINAKFRKYPSYKESLADYAMLMSGGVSGRSTFYQGAWKSTTSDYKEATKYLTGRYATDSRYHEKLNGLIETYDLTKYDSAKVKKESVKKTKETEKFIKEIAPKIEEVADKNDVYASVLIAEAIMKSNSGNNELMEKYNIYQTTGKFKDQSVKVETLKTDLESNKTSLDSKEYKVYSSTDEAIEDYISELKKDETTFIEMTRIKKDTPKKVTAYLTAQNKEDRRYHKRLNGLIDTYNLTKYDKLPKTVKKETEETKPVDVVNELGANMVAQLAESFSPTKLSSLTTK
ncbi:glucosaminidase domain-containing protein [Vagococcus bubulae]|uniref:glucosaminidase domain-containing protein n=1 Tax=Vagococcus bubulae TaxID=1977868 RepID=UPI0014022569|nr:glucosaminidase domain-containing protein [Vagococcus bubulae]